MSLASSWSLLLLCLLEAAHETTASTCIAEAECGAWTFPAGQLGQNFLLNPISLPSTFTIEAKVKLIGMPDASKLLFSLEKSHPNGNCILEKSTILPDNDWHFVTVTSDGGTYVDGVAVADQYQNLGTTCAGGTASFSIANDQDGVGNVNDANQATGLQVNFVAIYYVRCRLQES